MSPSGYDLLIANASDVALPGETTEADPYGALAYLESTGQTVAPPLSQLAPAPSPLPAVSAPSVLTNSFTVGGFQIPYWAIGVGLAAAYLYSRRK